MRKIILTIVFFILIIQPISAQGKNCADKFIEIAQDIQEILKKYEVIIYTRYSKAQLNIRENPSIKARIIGTVNFGEKVQVIKCNKNYVMLLKNNKKIGFISKKYLTKKEPKYQIYNIPESSGYKSFMSYEKITDTSSPQWKLQQEQAYNGDYGIRMVNGRYCVAIGFAFNPKIGQYFDLILKNGTIIPCVIADEKATEDTVDNIYTAANGCYTEFVVDENCLKNKVTQMGDISYCYDKWKSPVVMIKIYKENIL